MKAVEEVHVLSTEDRLLLQKAKEIILKHLPAARIVLYGSVARGTQEADSDYDLFALTGRALSMDEKDAVWSGIYSTELEKDMLLSVMFCSEDQWNAPAFRGSPRRFEIEQDGVIL